MSAHAPLLEPFERPDLRFFFCKHKLARVLPPRQQTFFSRGVASRDNDKKRLRDNRCDELHSHVTAAQLQLLSSDLFITFIMLLQTHVPLKQLSQRERKLATKEGTNAENRKSYNAASR